MVREGIKVRSYGEYNQRRKQRVVEKDTSPLFYIVLMVLTIVMLLSYLMVQTQISQVGYALEEKRQEITGLKRTCQDLRMEVSGKTNLRMVEQRARQELGMERPASHLHVYLDTPPPTEEIRVATTGALSSFFADVSSWFRERATVRAGALGE